MNFNFAPVYPHHDLLVEIGEVEMAMEDLDEDEQQSGLESRMQSLLEALDHLAV
ncbi:MAG: hypothetical protein ACREPQ_12160 [Rhodanobacter sp.]